MPSYLTALLFVAASITALGFATPLPLPLQTADIRRFDLSLHTSREELRLRQRAGDVLDGGLLGTISLVNLVGSGEVLNKRGPRRRGLLGDGTLDGLLGNVNILNAFCSQASSDARTMKSLAAQSASTNAGDKTYQQQAAARATSFHMNLLGFRTLLDQLGRDKGLANYDRSDAVQTALKNLVNTNKNLLSSIDVMVENVPELGPVLGPIVYDIKCILDDILNAVENLTDGLLNNLKPLLQGAIGRTTATCCKSGIQIVGLCLLG